MYRISVFARTLDILHGSPLNDESALRESSAYREQSKLGKKLKNCSNWNYKPWFQCFHRDEIHNIFHTEFAAVTQGFHRDKQPFTALPHLLAQY